MATMSVTFISLDLILRIVMNSYQIQVQHLKSTIFYRLKLSQHNREQLSHGHESVCQSNYFLSFWMAVIPKQLIKFFIKLFELNR